MVKGFIYSYNSNEKSWNNLIQEYKNFEIEFNEILKPTYKSIFDEKKRAFWLTKKTTYRMNIDLFLNKLFNLIKSNFKNSSLINLENKDDLVYLKEKKSNRIYKIEEFGPLNYYYSSALKEGVVVIRFTIVLKRNKIVLYYKNCYYTKKLISYVTLSDTVQKLEIRKQFNINWLLIKGKIEKVIQ